MALNLLSDRNSGFKKNDGSINRLLYLCDKIYKGFENEKEIAIVLLDVTKAFDKVWHKGLLFKLQQFGVGGNLLAWFSSYLNMRSQKVVIKGKSSSLKHLLAGVPQGSILGPLLFLIYINDIEDGITSDLNLFADDTALCQEYSNKLDAERILNSDLEKIRQWGCKWLVEFNPTKTVFVNFSLKKNKSTLNLIFNDINIAQVSEQKHLGVVLSEDMRWSKHISYISKKAMKQKKA